MPVLPVYSTRFIASNQAVGAAAVNYVVPAGRVAVIKFMTAASSTVHASQAGVSIIPATGSPVVSVWQPFFAAGVALALQYQSLACSIVVEAGGTIRIGVAGTAGEVVGMTVSGYLLFA